VLSRRSRELALINMMDSAHAAYAVGGIFVAGGLFTSYKQKSLVPLLDSLIVGGGLFTGGYLISHGEYDVGHLFVAVSTAGLTAVGFSTYLKARKSMPATPTIILGGLSGAYQFKKAINHE
jgi:uncharacterized membrane protein (UPF0136 family)